MWHQNKKVKLIYVVHTTQAVWALIDTVAGWKRVKTGAADGVTNLSILLTTAKANNRPVDVYIVDEQILRAILR